MNLYIISSNFTFFWFFVVFFYIFYLSKYFFWLNIVNLNSFFFTYENERNGLLQYIYGGFFFSISQHLDSPDQSAALEKNDGTILWTLKTLPPQAESVAQFRVRSVFMLRINQFKNVIHVLYKYCMLAGIHLQHWKLSSLESELQLQRQCFLGTIFSSTDDTLASMQLYIVSY